MSQSKQETQTSSQTSPWGPQADALKDAFGNAQTAYGQASQANAPTNFTAGMTPDQLSTFRQMLGYGNSANSMTNAQGASGVQNLGAGSTGMQGALNGYGAFNPNSTNNTSDIINSANQYAAGQDIPGAVKAAMQGATEQARDVTIPGMESAAAGNGNINSSRTGVSEGIVQRGLAEQAGNLSTQMHNDAYQQGLGLAQTQAQTNNAQQLAALQGQGALGQALAGQGSNDITGSINNQSNLFNILGAAGAGQQQGNQLDLTNQLQQYQSGVSSPYDALQGLMGIIGSNNWGSNSTGTSTTTQTPSMFQTIGGLMNAGGSLLGGFKLSDREAKADIKRVGQLDNGLTVYRYRYKGSKKFHIGLMAQDVEELVPDAVLSVEGIKFVNYDIATRAI